MTTVDASNVHNIAIEGTFDDCQELVKAMFGDTEFRDTLHLSAVNSINWARIMAQVVYYVTAALALGAPDRKVSFAVPTGNFGDVFAGYAATRMGLPVGQLLIATNANDILARFFATGTMTKEPVIPTLSPAMDIQVSSNFERLLFDLCGRDARVVGQSMASFRDSGAMSVSAETLNAARTLFDAARLDDEGTRRIIARTFAEAGILIDPHTATAVHAAQAVRRDPAVPMIVLGLVLAARALLRPPPGSTAAPA